MNGVIPRYLPAVSFSDAVSLWAASQRAEDLVGSRFVPSTVAWHAYAFQRARLGLTAWLRSLRVEGGNRVLVSAQICPAVRQAIRAAGLMPSFLDADAAYPTPSPSQFAAALADGVVGVIIAPMYGYIHRDWSVLTAALGSTPLCLDMAQGLLLDDRLAALFERADAALYSLSLGKGVDIGGGLLFVREPLPGISAMRTARPFQASVVAAGLAWRALVWLGLYRAAVPFIEQAIDRDQIERASVEIVAPRDPSRQLNLWAVRVEAFARDVRRARARARRIGALPSVRAACHDVDVFCDDEGAMHLRQVLRLRRPDRRPAVIATMRSLGVDCAPAGEPLPSGDTPERAFPNAARFTRDAIRLPFLGRLTDGQQSRVERALQVALG